MLDQKLFDGILNQAVRDLVDPDHRKRAYNWIMDTNEISRNPTRVTFMDCCDFTGRSPITIRKVAEGVRLGHINQMDIDKHFDD